MTSELPVVAILPALKTALTDHVLVLLSAPAGSGKTTLVPPALLAEPWLLNRKIVMLEPRRVAARLACRYMAHLINESPGGLVGYRTRFDSQVSTRTRIEIMTEGVLTRRIQHDPDLADVGLIIFDEVHERHLTTDLGLALSRDIQRSIRPDLRLLLMSATLDPVLARQFDHAPHIIATGRQYPVTIRYLDRPTTVSLGEEVRRAVVSAMVQSHGDILVFLPGAREISECQRALVAQASLHDFDVCRLHGDMSPIVQDEILQKSAGRRVILTTAIAQTSVTIPGVDVVIDAGLARSARWDKITGFTRLITVPVSRDVADQRAGRAGRLGPGLCIRLWTEADHRGRPQTAPPEMEMADLSPLAWDLAVWGTPDGDLPWISPPPEAALTHSFRLLIDLGLISPARKMTAEGRMAYAWGLAPRAAAIIVHAPLALRSLACALALVFTERDMVRMNHDCTIESRLTALVTQTAGSTIEAHRKLARKVGVEMWCGSAESARADIARLLLPAFPDRVARRKDTEMDFKLASGQRASVDPADPLAHHAFLIAVDVEEIRGGARIRIAAPVPRSVWDAYVSDCAQEVMAMEWDSDAHTFTARKERKLGALVLHSTPCIQPPPHLVVPALIDAVRRSGTDALPWSENARFLRARLQSVKRFQPSADWPDVSEAALVAAVEQWLIPAVESLAPPVDLSRLDIALGIRLGVLTPSQYQRLEVLAPAALRLRSGRMYPLRYPATGSPVLAAPIQEFYGCVTTPAIMGGTEAVLLELLSPGRRPLQVTHDINNFWKTVYPELRRSLAARYPRHAWPEDPLHPPPVSLSRRPSRR